MSRKIEICLNDNCRLVISYCPFRILVSYSYNVSYVFRIHRNKEKKGIRFKRLKGNFYKVSRPFVNNVKSIRSVSRVMYLL